MTPTATTTKERRARTDAPAGPRLMSINPVTRVGGSLGVKVEVDDGLITNAYALGNLFRGYENIVSGRDPRDALMVTSRACGWCGAVHMTTSSMALEMAWGMEVPPMASAMRSIATATEAIWIHAAHLAVRAAPDYCAPVVQRTSPRLWRRAASTRAPGAAIHGYKTIGELMEGLIPASGRYWTETIPAGRRVQQMINLLYGKYPHPSVLIPGGLTQTLSIGTFTEYFTRIYLSVDYVKEVVALWDDLIDFLYEADPRFMDLGTRPTSFIHAGCWDDVRASNAFGALDETGRRRLAGPGVMVNGQLVTESLSDVHNGIEEDVSHSFYERWEASGGVDPVGASLPSGHPWSKRTIPKPAPADPNGSYSWSTAPRWRGEVVESTPLGRLWLTALRNDLPPNEFIESTGKSVRILVPLNMYPEMVVEWRIPDRANALERLRADAYGIAFAGLCAAISLLRGFELTRTGEVDRHVSFKVKKGPSAGVGLWESGRGMNVHWVRMDKGRMTGYQILGPSTWNVSPRDASGKLGPLEEALVGSPIMEVPGDDGSLTGIDALRVIHSFDPCMNCAVH